MTRFRINIQNIKLFILLFTYFFNIKLKLVPIVTTQIMLALLGIIYLLVYFPRVITVKLNFKVCRHIYLYIFLLLLIFLSLVIHHSTDLSFAYLFIVNNTIVFLGAFFISLYILKNKISKICFFKIFVIAYFIQMIFVAFFFFNREICKQFYTFIDMGDRVNTNLEEWLGYRAFGISFGFDMGTADLTVALIFCIYLYFTEERKYKRWLFIYLFCALFGILVARTMFVGIGISLIMFFFFPTFNKIRKVVALFNLVILLSSVVVLFMLFFDVDKYMRTIWWVTDIFVQLFSGKGLSSGSLYELTQGDMIFCPEMKILLLGEGHYDIALVSRYTDVGYIRLIMYFGLFGFCTYFVYVYSRVNLFIGLRKSIQEKYICFFLYIFQVIFFWKIYYPITSFPLLLMYGIMSGKVGDKTYIND